MLWALLSSAPSHSQARLWFRLGFISPPQEGAPCAPWWTEAIAHMNLFDLCLYHTCSTFAYEVHPRKQFGSVLRSPSKESCVFHGIGCFCQGWLFLISWPVGVRSLFFRFCSVPGFDWGVSLDSLFLSSLNCLSSLVRNLDGWISSISRTQITGWFGWYHRKVWWDLELRWSLSFLQAVDEHPPFSIWCFLCLDLRIVGISCHWSNQHPELSCCHLRLLCWV